MRRTIVIVISIAIVLLVLVTGLLMMRGEARPGEGERRFSPRAPLAEEKFLEARRLFLTSDSSNYQKALQLLEEALTIQSDYPEALAAWAEIISMWYGFQLTEERYQLAYARAQRAVRLAPDLDMGYRAMADVFRHHCDPQTGRCDTEFAMDLIERALAINPESAENWYVKGSIYLKVDLGEAVNYLERARQLNPNLARTYFNLAIAHKMVAEKLLLDAGGDPELLKEASELARPHFERAVETMKIYQQMVPRALNGYCALGIIYFNHGMIAEAKEMFLRTLGANPNPDPSQERWRQMAYFHLTSIYWREGDYEKAKFYAERSLESAPYNLDAVLQLVRLCELMQDQECEDHYRQRRDELIKELEERGGSPIIEGAPGQAGPAGGAEADHSVGPPE